MAIVWISFSQWKGNSWANLVFLRKLSVFDSNCLILFHIFREVKYYMEFFGHAVYSAQANLSKI